MTIEQAHDFLEETKAFQSLIADISDSEFHVPTQFKQWTVDMVLRHLHVWNTAAGLSLSDPQAFADFLKRLTSMGRGEPLPIFEQRLLNGLSGPALRDIWLDEAKKLASLFAVADPKSRLPWVGPEMSARSSITARLMETWAHAQAVYDILGVDRQDEDRIGNIVRLGVNTYEWTFRNRREVPPGPMPSLMLTAPSGTIWRYGEGDDMISGKATEFCQVVTQTRNVADTSLRVTGDIATRWMEIAQCFAGRPVDPPPAGTRFRTCKIATMF